MPKQEHVDHADIRDRLDALVDAAEIATEADEPLDEVIARIRWALDEKLSEIAGEIEDQQKELDGLEAEYEETLENDEADAEQNGEQPHEAPSGTAKRP